jgi:hypothetical protein
VADQSRKGLRRTLHDLGETTVITDTPSVEADELAAAHRGIAAAEPTLARGACEAFNAEVVVPQNATARTLKGSSREGLPSDLLAG